MLRYLLLFILPIHHLCAEAPFAYPDSHPQNLTETIHGVQVSDPYRWLEDLNSDKTKAWIVDQNELTTNYLEDIPGRSALNNHLTKLWNYERYGTPFKEGGNYFFSKNNGLQNQSVLYTTGTSLNNPPEVILDPNTLSEDGTLAVSDYSVSPDGNYLAYSLSKSGSDWVEWKIRDIETKQDLPDHLLWSKFSGATWSKDSKGFYYVRYDAPAEGDEYTETNTGQKVYYHRLQTPQSEDKLIYERKDQPLWGFHPFITDDEQYLIISVRRGTDTKRGLFYKDLTKPNTSFIELLNKFDASYYYIGNKGSTFYLTTNLDSPKKRIISLDLNKPDRKHWKTLIPESEATIRQTSFMSDQFIINYMKDAHSEIRRFDSSGASLGSIKLPGIGSASGFRGDTSESETFYKYSSFTEPGTVYRYDISTNKTTVFKETKPTFDKGSYVTKQVFYASKDGSKIPMFIVHKKDIELDGNNPTHLYGYGGFNISLTPRYSPAVIAWLDMGGVYAVPNLRGGGEYGKSWHQAGMLHNKQNVFDDFIAAAEYLITNKYTSNAKLAISGRSNGGLLAAACLVQRPDLFGACIPGVGVLDMLRFHKFTIGWAWIPEYGSPDEAESFKKLRAYSPYHNLVKGSHYPATMIMTSDHDDRVVPSHSYKFAAALQAANEGPKPMLIRIETKSGHGAGTPTSKRIKDAVDKYLFLSQALDFSIKLEEE